MGCYLSDCWTFIIFGKSRFRHIRTYTPPHPRKYKQTFMSCHATGYNRTQGWADGNGWWALLNYWIRVMTSVSIWLYNCHVSSFNLLVVCGYIDPRVRSAFGSLFSRLCCFSCCPSSFRPHPPLHSSDTSHNGRSTHKHSASSSKLTGVTGNALVIQYDGVQGQTQTQTQTIEQQPQDATETQRAREPESMADQQRRNEVDVTDKWSMRVLSNRCSCFCSCSCLLLSLCSLRLLLDTCDSVGMNTETVLKARILKKTNS